MASQQSQKSLRSTLAAETLSLQEGLEDAVYLHHLLRELLCLQDKALPIIAYVDNKSLVEAVHSTKLVDDKRLRLDIGAIKESLHKREVVAIHWLPGMEQIA